MGELIKPVIDIIIKANDETHGWLFKILALTAAWKMFNLSFLISPIGLIIALGAALLLLYDDWKTWEEGGESAIDWGSDTGTAIKAVVGGLGLLAASITITKGLFMAWAIASKVAAAAQMAFNVVMTMNPIGLVIIAISALILAGYELVKHWDVVKKWFHEFFDWFEKKWAIVSGITDKISGMVGDSFHKIEGSITGHPLGADVAKNVTVQQNTTMHINGAQSPQATAQAVAAQQTHVNAQMTRNMTGRAR
jgi:hypothetical protein